MRTVEQAGLVRVARSWLMAERGRRGTLRGDADRPGRIVVRGALSFLCLSVGPHDLPGLAHDVPGGPGGITRPVLIVGIDDQTAEICEVMADHRELGFEPVGVIGSRGGRRAGRPRASSGCGDLDSLRVRR